MKLLISSAETPTCSCLSTGVFAMMLSSVCSKSDLPCASCEWLELSDEQLAVLVDISRKLASKQHHPQ